MCHSILFQYLLKILVNVIRFLQYFLQICYKVNAPCQVPCFTCGAQAALGRLSYYVECPLLSALLYARGPTRIVRSSNVQLFL